jgi:hypothetical protein
MLKTIILSLRNNRKEFDNMNQEKLIKFTNVLLGIMFYTGIAIVLCLPILLKLAGKYYSSAITVKYWPMLFVYGVAGICGITIVKQLWKMVRTVMNKNCFVIENVNSLRLMGKMSFIICIIFMIKILILPTPVTFVIILTFFIAGIFSKVLSFVFEEAIRYKEENDFTI